MPQVIPTFNTGTVAYNVSLNGTVFFIRTYWNEYAAMWFLDLLDSNLDPVVYGLALVPNINILRFNGSFVETIGDLRISTVNTNNDTPTSLGTDALLYYFTPGEFNALYPDYNTVDFRPQQFVFSDLYTVLP